MTTKAITTKKKRARFRGTKIATVATALGAFGVLFAGIATSGDGPEGGDGGGSESVTTSRVVVLQQPIVLPSGQQLPAGSQVVAQAPAKASPPKVTTRRKSRGS